MSEIHINYLAVLIAVVANFIIGFIWYTPLFGKAWGKEMGFDMTQKPPQGAMLKGMILMIIGNFLMAYVFAHNIAAWSFVPGSSEMGNAQNAFMAAVFTWLGFFVPTELSRVGWEMKSWKLFCINAGYHLVALLVVAFILIYMK